MNNPSPLLNPVDLPGYFKLNADMDWEDSVFALYPQSMMIPSLEEVNEVQDK